MSEKIACGKCGSEFERLNIEYKTKCYGSGCGWTDSDIDEHLHMTCPVCGYTEAEACRDYQHRKAEALGNKAQHHRPMPVTTYQPNLYGGHNQRSTVGWDSNLD